MYVIINASLCRLLLIYYSQLNNSESLLKFSEWHLIKQLDAHVPYWTVPVTTSAVVWPEIVVYDVASVDSPEINQQQ